MSLVETDWLAKNIEDVKIIAIDLWDEYENETKWTEDITSVSNIFTDIENRFNLQLSDVIIASESFGTTSTDIIDANDYFTNNSVAWIFSVKIISNDCGIKHLF